MIASLTIVSISQAKPPEALDSEFLDYLAACESDEDNWTVVADEELRKKVEADQKQKPKPSPVKDADPKRVRP